MNVRTVSGMGIIVPRHFYETNTPQLIYMKKWLIIILAVAQFVMVLNGTVMNGSVAT